MERTRDCVPQESETEEMFDLNVGDCVKEESSSSDESEDAGDTKLMLQCQLCSATPNNAEWFAHRRAGGKEGTPSGELCRLCGHTLEVWPLEDKSELVKRHAASAAFRSSFESYRSVLEKGLALGYAKRSEEVNSVGRLGMRVMLRAKMVESSVFVSHFGVTPKDLRLTPIVVQGPTNTAIEGVLFWGGDLPEKLTCLEVELYSEAERSLHVQLLSPHLAVRPGQSQDRYHLAATSFGNATSIKADHLLTGKLASYSEMKKTSEKLNAERQSKHEAEEQARLDGLAAEDVEHQCESTLQNDGVGLPDMSRANAKKKPRLSGSANKSSVVAKPKGRVSPSSVGSHRPAPPPPFAQSLVSAVSRSPAQSTGVVALAMDAVGQDDIHPSDSVSVAGSSASAQTKAKPVPVGRSEADIVQAVLGGWANGREMKTDL